MNVVKENINGKWNSTYFSNMADAKMFWKYLMSQGRHAICLRCAL